MDNSRPVGGVTQSCPSNQSGRKAKQRLEKYFKDVESLRRDARKRLAEN